MKKFVFATLLFFLFGVLAPTFSAFAQQQPENSGLIPCGAEGQDPCTLCHGLVLVNNVVKFLLVPSADLNNGFAMVPLIAGLLVAAGGFLMFTGAASPENLRHGQTIIFAVVVGLVIIYGSWLFISVFLDAIGVVSWTGLNNWHELTCNLTPQQQQGSSEGGGTTRPGPPGPVPSPGIAINSFTADGIEHAFVDPTMQPFPRVTLEWKATGTQSCTALSNPSNLWSDTKSNEGKEIVDLSATPSGTTIQFTLDCAGGLAGSPSKTVFTTISSQSGTAGTPPTIEFFEAKHADAPQSAWGSGPFTCCGAGTDFPDDSIEFSWSADADTCVGEEQFGGLAGGNPDGQISVLMPPFSAKYEYKLKCINPGGSVDQTIIVDRLP